MKRSDSVFSSSHPPQTSTQSPPPQPHPTPPLRFKRKRAPSPAPQTPRSPTPSPAHHSKRRSRRHHHHHHRSHHRPLTPSPPPHSTPPLDSETAFRESLFDALADDEGAAFWEGVYGQPIHTYSRYHAAEDVGGEGAKLAKMTDEEYVSYVRGKMWEKSYGFIEQERRKRGEERAKGGGGGRGREGREERERRRMVDEAEGRWGEEVEGALRRGEERRRREKWRKVWGGYVGWWDGERFEGGGKGLRERICWPVESGRWRDVDREGLERFYKHAPRAAGEEGGLGDVLKRERVRWHPDKMQQRAGGGGIDEGTMKLVTAVFQVVDRLWREMKEKG